MSTTWVVHKFGGTSLADAARYHAAGRILLSDSEVAHDAHARGEALSDLPRLVSYLGAPQ